MLIVLISWIIITFISFISGDALLALLRKKFQIQKPVHFSLICLSGFAFLSLICSWISLFSGINEYVFLIITILCVVRLIIKFKSLKRKFQEYFNELKSTPLALKLLFLIGLITTLAYSAFPSKCYDEGFYYIQNIKWNYMYPVVPGLGNLECRLAFNSSWHLLAALFSFRGMTPYDFDDINGLLFIFVILYALSGANKLITGEYRLNNILKTGLLLPGFLFYSSIMGPAADLAVTLFIWIIVILFVEKIEDSSIYMADEKMLLIWLFSFFLITVKLSAIPILILPVYLIWSSIRKKSWKIITVLFPLSLIIICPWLIRNVILSGYILYPLPVLNIFHYDWKFPMSELMHLNSAIEGWARTASNNYQEVNSLPYSKWIPIWFSIKRIYDKLIIIGFILSFICISFHVIKNAKKYLLQKHYLVLFFTVSISIFLWFIKAPDLRFAYSYLIIGIIISLAIIFRKKLLVLPLQRTKNIILFSGILAFGFMCITLYIVEKPLALMSYSVAPAPYPIPVFTVIKVDGHPVYVPNEYQCWDGPLPCQSQLQQRSPYHFRTNNLKDGFKAQ